MRLRAVRRVAAAIVSLRTGLPVCPVVAFAARLDAVCTPAIPCWPRSQLRASTAFARWIGAGHHMHDVGGLDGRRVRMTARIVDGQGVCGRRADSGGGTVPSCGPAAGAFDLL